MTSQCVVLALRETMGNFVWWNAIPASRGFTIRVLNCGETTNQRFGFACVVGVKNSSAVFQCIFNIYLLRV
jgi:hypothetical protein